MNDTNSRASTQEEISASRARAEELNSKSDPLSGPIPLQGEICNPQPFPFAALGSIFGAAAQRVYEIVKAPDAVCGQSFLGAASLIAQSHIDVRIDERLFPTSLFLISIAESGDRKSAVDKIALQPIANYQKKLVDRSKLEKIAYKNGCDLWKKKRETALKDENATLLRVLCPPEPPLEPIIIAEEPTYEGLVHLFNIGQPSMGLFSDEAGRMIGGHGMNDENVLKTACGLSSLWDGKPVTRVRRGDECLVLYGRRLSMHLMMQGVVFEKILANRIYTEQGLLARCLIVRPLTMMGNRPYQKIDLSSDPKILEYYTRAEALMSRQPSTKEGVKNELTPRVVVLSSKAKEEWKNFYDRIEFELRSEGKYRPVSGLANKIPDMCLRIAGILAFIDDPEVDLIDEEVLNRAITLSLWYLEEAVRIREVGLIDKDMEIAQKLLRWMQEQKQKNPRCLISVQDITRGTRAVPSRKKRDVDRILHLLRDHGFVVEVEFGKWDVIS